MPDLISVVVPVYGCRDCLIELHKKLAASFEILSVDYEILLVNDGSTDGAWDVIRALCEKDPKIKGVNLSRNFGQHSAIFAGLSYVRGNYVVVMDCDLQDDPSEIPNFYKKINEGYDAVLGRRSQRQDSWFKRKSSQIFYQVLSYLTSSKLDANIANFGMYRMPVIQAVISMGDKIRFFPVMVQWVGFKATAIEIQHGKRLAGNSAYTLARLLRLATNVVLSFSNRPLDIIVNAGFTLSGLALACAVFVVFYAFFGGVSVPGWSSVIISLWFLSGVQIVVMGILGIYIGKIFDASKNRPIFLVKEILNSLEKP